MISRRSAALDHRPIPPEVQGTTNDRARLIKALIHLSVSSELFPSSLQISQVQKEKDPVDFGMSGEVYRGHLTNRTVAVKVFKTCKRHLKDLLAHRETITTEAIIWCQLYHENIVPCYGVHCDPAKAYIVSPWMENGNIPKYLRANENAEAPINRALLLSDIASGMAYLHSDGIVHGDLKAVNVLVSASHRACLTDFGLSTTSEVSGWTSPPKMRAPGAPRWHAPELSDPRDGLEVKITTMSDVYSFGNVCYEIMTGKLPLYETKNNTRVQLRVLRGDRPSKPALQDPAFRKYGLTEDIWDFIQACWLQEPKQRPTAKDLCEHPVLSSLADHRPPQEWGEGFRSRLSQ
ncbi:kinase-like protein [Coprinellus micaceus]|uniref:Kinase-like protein n=1 Tax=Coprinellus micaceus TaxID=71717 RepID=A0A4Y7SKT8_COPMI|nr:kinase-like protein [Coprinellus micaceus]